MKINNRVSHFESEKKKKFIELYKNCSIPEQEILSNLGLFITSRDLKRILFLNDLYKKIIDVNGVIFELGTRYGQNMVLFSSFRDIYEPYNNFRKIVGFDTFQGFLSVHDKDGINEYNRMGNYSVPNDYEIYLGKLLDFHNSLTPTEHIQKYQLIKGDACKTINDYLKEYPSTIIALAYFDLDLYEPTKICLEKILPHLTKGSIVVFDELNNEQFPGETIAVREVMGLDKYKIHRAPYSGAVSYIIIE